jgi:hypothetical protein
MHNHFLKFEVQQKSRSARNGIAFMGSILSLFLG